jgi:hypothetical protein
MLELNRFLHTSPRNKTLGDRAMHIRNQRDLWSGVLFMAFGLAFVFFARDYNLGTAAKMGPAYFPTVLGGLLTILGAAICINGIGHSSDGSETGVRIDATGWRELLLILFAVIAFAATLPSMGIIVSIVILIWLSSPASHEFKVRDTLIATVVLLALSYLVFVRGLELQFPFLPKFISS